jgi:hypothetical protein
MKIKAIAFSGSNPSMGPHDSPSQRRLNVEPYPQEVEDLLDHTQVNGAVSLREYLALRLADDQDRVREVHQAFDCGSLRSGQRIIDLVIRLEGGPTVTLSDLRTFSLEGSGWKAFNELIREEGTVSSSPSPAEIKMKPDSGSWTISSEREPRETSAPQAPPTAE